MLYHDIPDCWPREPDDLYESAPSWAEESAEQYRCPECGYIGVATLHIQRQHGREYVDVECRACQYDGISETRDIATAGACQACEREYAVEGGDYCAGCEAVIERTELALPKTRDEWIEFVRAITLAQGRRS